MRVLFLGTTGTEKKKVMYAVQRMAFEEMVAEGELAAKTDPNEIIKIIGIEDRICSGVGSAKYGIGPLASYLDSFERERRGLWRESMLDIIKETEKFEGHVFLSLHGFFWRGRQLFCDIDWDLLARFEPSVVVTLCDDLYDIQRRVQLGDPKGCFKNQLLLREISAWRSAELAIADMLATALRINPSTYFGEGLDSDRKYDLLREALDKLDKNLTKQFGKPLKNFLVGIKHRPNTIYNLLFRRDILPVYTSFSISHVRSKKTGLMNSIDAFRNKISDLYTVFDPLAIDEYILSDRDAESGAELSLSEMIHKYTAEYRVVDYRWPFGDDSTVPGCIDSVIKGEEYVHVLSDIKKQIPERDFRLLDQVRQLGGVVACYRPLIEGHEAGGVREELNYATKNSMTAYAYHPPEDKVKVHAFGPLDPYNKLIYFDTEQALFDALAKHSRRKLKNRTWEL